MNKHTRTLAVAASAWLALTSPGLAAQDDAGEDRANWANWYQVELVIFSNNASDTAERWPRHPQLSYPADGTRIGSAATTTSPAELGTLITVEDTVPGPPLDLRTTPEPPLTEQQTLQEIHPEVLLRLPRAWTALPKEQRELVDRARQLQRRDAYTVLYSKAWRQVIRPRDSTLPIIIESSERRGLYPRLQGSISLSRSRYLHLSTRLWLNSDARYYDDDWRMAAPPQVPDQRSLQMEPFVVSLLPGWDQAPQEAELAPPVAVGEDELDADPDGQDGATAAAPLEDAAASPYPWRHAILIEQKRRMRSGELHYLDHPALGILIKVTPYEFEPFTVPAAVNGAESEPVARR